MSTRHVGNMCGLYCPAEFAEYRSVEFFIYLIGAGVSRSLYQLTAADRGSGRAMFDMKVEASAEALERRAALAGTSADAQAVVIALQHARQIVDQDRGTDGAHFHLRIEAGGSTLQQISSA
jgi:hypothetical protein